MGYDTPRPLGDSAFGGTLCAPIFAEFMKVAMAGQGPVEWPVPPGGHFIKIDRRTGQRLPDNATGANVQAEYIRDGQQMVVGGYGQTVDGGWKMGADVPLFEGVSQAGGRAGAGARPDPGAAEEPLDGLDVERRALLRRGPRLRRVRKRLVVSHSCDVSRRVNPV